MSTGSSVKRNLIASWGVHASNLVIGFFLARYTFDVLGQTILGTWIFINSVANYLNLLYCGFGETVSRYVSKYHADDDQQRMNEVVSLIAYLFRGLGGIAFLFGCTMAATVGCWGMFDAAMVDQVRVACLILGLNVAVSMAGTPYGGMLHGLQRFDLERGVSFALDLLRLTLFLVFLRPEWGIVIIASIFFVVALFENLCYVILAYRLVPRLEVRWAHVKRETLRECGSFSSMSFVNAIASQIINATDLIVIGIMLNKEAIVPYNFGLRLSQFCRQPIDKIARICLPTAGALHSEADRAKRLLFLVQSLGLAMLLITGLFIGAWYFGGDVLRLWVGPKMTSENHLVAHRILMILLGANLVAVPCGIFRAFLFALGNVKIPAIIYVLEAIFNIGLSLMLCGSYGIEGVAWGTAIPVILVELGILLPYAVRNLGLSWTRLFQEAVWPTVIPLLTIWAYAMVVSRQSWSHESWPTLAAIAIAGGAVLGAMRWFSEIQSNPMLFSPSKSQST
jgi:O-antigen/teichoic acid export membrane protein